MERTCHHKTIFISANIRIVDNGEKFDRRQTTKRLEVIRCQLKAGRVINCAGGTRRARHLHGVCQGAVRSEQQRQAAPPCVFTHCRATSRDHLADNITGAYHCCRFSYRGATASSSNKKHVLICAFGLVQITFVNGRDVTGRDQLWTAALLFNSHSHRVGHWHWVHDGTNVI